MHPNLYIQEKLVAQRRWELERKAAYSYLLAGQPRQRLVMVRHLMAQLGSLLVALGSRMQQLEQNQQRQTPYPLEGDGLAAGVSSARLL